MQISRLAVSLLFALPAPAALAQSVEETVAAAIEPVMAEHEIPGMSVAVLAGGERHVLHFGVASRETERPVDDRTLFEIGSLSKPYTGTLAALLEAEGQVNFAASAESLLPELAGSAIGRASLLDLGTYAAGGLPLQFPDGVDRENFPTWYRDFAATGEPGTSRLYSNPSIGLFGHLAAASAGGSFDDLLAEKLLAPLGLSDTFLAVPDDRQEDYALGTTRDGASVRVNPGLFDSEAYGVKTTADDLLAFVEASMNPPEGALGEALAVARSGVYRVAAMHQGLGWELYGAPARVDDLLQGADPDFVLEPNAIEQVGAPVGDPATVGTVSKTGSTGGFGAYALFAPERGTAIVFLANRFWPNDVRIRTAHAILTELDPGFAAR